MHSAKSEILDPIAFRGPLELPTVQEASRAAALLAAANTRFAGMLAEGLPEVEAFARFGMVLFQEGRVQEAAAVFRFAVSLAPENPVLWANLGTVLDGADELAKAAISLEYSLELSPHQPDTWLLLGLVRKKKGDFERCEDAYRTALEQSPESGAAWQCLGLLKNEQKDYSQAIECFRAAVRWGAASAAIAANLGKLYYQVGRFQEACDAYDRALALDAGNALYRDMSRKCTFLRDMIHGKTTENALIAWKRSLDLAGNRDDDQRGFLRAAFGQLSGFGHVDAAKRVGEKYLEQWPGDAVLGYLMKALEGAAEVERSPSDYVTEYFDSFAEGFDEKLVEVLGYEIPREICMAIGAATHFDHKYDAADIGCGTGLCGPLVKPFSKTLTGVDLSPRMLAQAAKRNVYDELACEEATAFLHRSPAQFDLVLAADVMVYIGDLRAIFAAAADGMKPGGLFAFTTELWTGTGYRLQTSGRFSHAPEYIRSLAAPDFEEHVCTRTTIRLEAGTRVPGNLFLFRRKA